MERGQEHAFHLIQNTPGHRCIRLKQANGSRLWRWWRQRQGLEKERIAVNGQRPTVQWPTVGLILHSFIFILIFIFD